MVQNQKATTYKNIFALLSNNPKISVTLNRLHFINNWKVKCQKQAS